MRGGRPKGVCGEQAGRLNPMRCDGVSTRSRERSAMDYRLYPVSDVLTASMSSRNHSSAATGPRDPRPSRTTSSRFCRTSIRGRTGVAGTREGQPVRPSVDGAGTHTTAIRLELKGNLRVERPELLAQRGSVGPRLPADPPRCPCNTVDSAIGTSRGRSDPHRSTDLLLDQVEGSSEPTETGANEFSPQRMSETEPMHLSLPMNSGTTKAERLI